MSLLLFSVVVSQLGEVHGSRFASCMKMQTFVTLDAKVPAEILFYVCKDNSYSNILEVF